MFRLLSRLIPLLFIPALWAEEKSPETKVVPPESKVQVTILGAVAKPGRFQLASGKSLTLEELAKAAGGTTAGEGGQHTTALHVKRRDGSVIDIKNGDNAALQEKVLPLREGDIFSFKEVVW